MRCSDFQIEKKIFEIEISPSSIWAQNHIYCLVDPLLESRVNLSRKTTKIRISVPVALMENIIADLDTSKKLDFGPFWGLLVSPSQANEKA